MICENREMLTLGFWRTVSVLHYCNMNFQSLSMIQFICGLHCLCDEQRHVEEKCMQILYLVI
jgi:hypothetical protein